MSRYGYQEWTLLLESFGGDDSARSLGAMFHAHRGPLERLPIQIFQTVKMAAGKKVRLHRPEAPLFPCLTIGVALFMAHKLKPVLAGEVAHLRHHHGVGTTAPQTGQIGVVDNADLGGIAPEPESFMQKALHPEAVEATVEAQIAALGVAQIDHAGDQPSSGGAQLNLIGAGVMLHFGAGYIGHAATTLLLPTLAQAELVHATQDSGVGNFQAFFFHQFLVHTLYPSFAVRVEPPQ